MLPRKKKKNPKPKRHSPLEFLVMNSKKLLHLLKCRFQVMQ